MQPLQSAAPLWNVEGVILANLLPFVPLVLEF